MRKCGQCGGRLRRVHRTFWERFLYMAVYACKECKLEEPVPRHYTHHFGKQSRCPRCGTFRVVRLKGRDRIDPMQGGFLNLIERLAGGKLHHCRFCRLQFYDRRKLASEVAPPEDPAVSAPTNPANSGA